MGTDDFRNRPEFKRGRTAEQIVAEELQRRGWFIVPSYDYSGEDNNKAPRLQGLTKAFVLPDLDASSKGKRCWVEVKCKASATFTRVMNRLEHGIPLRHFEAYHHVQTITGCKVWLCIFEEDTAAILVGSLDHLTRHARFYRGGKMSWGGMVFFPRDKFRIGWDSTGNTHAG